MASHRPPSSHRITVVVVIIIVIAIVIIIIACLACLVSMLFDESKREVVGDTRDTEGAEERKGEGKGLSTCLRHVLA